MAMSNSFKIPTSSFNYSFHSIVQTNKHQVTEVSPGGLFAGVAWPACKLDRNGSTQNVYNLLYNLYKNCVLILKYT